MVLFSKSIISEPGSYARSFLSLQCTAIITSLPFPPCSLALPYLTRLQIGDFGMARDLEDENYYISHGGKIPVKWTAPEVCTVHANLRGGHIHVHVGANINN